MHGGTVGLRPVVWLLIRLDSEDSRTLNYTFIIVMSSTLELKKMEDDKKFRNLALVC